MTMNSASIYVTQLSDEQVKVLKSDKLSSGEPWWAPHVEPLCFEVTQLTPYTCHLLAIPDSFQESERRIIPLTLNIK